MKLLLMAVAVVLFALGCVFLCASYAASYSQEYEESDSHAKMGFGLLGFAFVSECLAGYCP